MVREPSPNVSNWRATGSLDDDLIANGIVGICRIDTRKLVRHLRSAGVMRAGVFSGEALEDANGRLRAIDDLLDQVKATPQMQGLSLYDEVSTKQTYTIEPCGEYEGKEPLFTVAAVDLGIKAMTPHRMAERGCRVHVVPSTITFEQLQALNPDGVFFSNGPGDPEQAEPEVELLRQVLDAGYPFFGICFGNQLLGRALGFGTYKLKFGHRGINQPVKDMTTGKIEVTAHNHGFAVDAPIGETVPSPYGDGRYGRVVVSHIDLNDDVVEGLQCVDIPAFSVQYHPEAAAGPHDASYLFDRFVDLMRSSKEETRNAQRTDIKSVMVIGSGPIVIGQAAEFDYSGTQACRVLREEGIRVILVNSNPATIMTDPEIADATYVEPIATPIVASIIAKERPDALLPTLGGQTALNTAMALGEIGVLWNV